MTVPDPDDLTLVREFQAGSERAFNELVLRHRRNVFMTVAAIIGNRDDADDITQDVFLKAYQALPAFRGDSAFYTWIYRIAVNLSLNHMRRGRTRSFFGLEQIQAVMPDSLLADSELERTELSHKLRAAIRNLPPKQRAVFVLRFFRGMQHKEIAEAMDRDEGTIKANYFQAIRKLRASLGSYLKGKD